MNLFLCVLPMIYRRLDSSKSRYVTLRYVALRHVTGLLELGFLMFRVDDDSNANGLILLCIFFLSLHYAAIFLPRRVSKKCSIS